MTDFWNNFCYCCIYYFTNKLILSVIHNLSTFFCFFSFHFPLALCEVFTNEDHLVIHVFNIFPINMLIICYAALQKSLHFYISIQNWGHTIITKCSVMLSVFPRNVISSYAVALDGPRAHNPMVHSINTLL